MALDQLCTEIDSRTHAQAAAVLKAASEDAKRIVEEAHAASERTLSAAKKEAEEFAIAEGHTRLTACQLEAARHLVEAREEAVRQSLNQVWVHYKLLSKRGGYAAKLKAWAQQSLDELGHSNAVLHANENDSETLRAAGFKVSKTPLQCAGGVRAETPDGHIAVDCTFEAQFERKREDILHQIHQRLFSSDDSSLLEIPKDGDGDGGAAKKRGRTSPSGRHASHSRPSKFKARQVRPLSSSSMLSMPVSSRAGKWRRRKP